MVLEDFYMISQVVAAFAVMGSLIFVGLQMRQSDSTQQAIMHQSRAQRQIDIVKTYLEPHNAEALSKTMREARNLSSLERFRAGLFLRMTLLSTEDMVWQHQRGLLEDEVLNDQVLVLTRILGTMTYRAMWKLERRNYPPRFATYIDTLIETIPIRSQKEDIDAAWIEILEATEEEVGGPVSSGGA